MMDGLFRRRRLPHWDVEDGIYFVTACLADSLPSQGFEKLRRYRKELDSRRKPTTINELDWETRKHKLLFARFDQMLDTEAMVQFLDDPRAAEEVRKSLYFFAGKRYDLIAYVVMPSHFHWVFKPRPGGSCKEKKGLSPREKIMHSIKSYTGNRCNELLQRSGPFWQDESHDHVIRDEEEMLRIIEYVENNPVKAGLVSQPEEWTWSSCSDRKNFGLRPDEPLMLPEI